MVRELILFDFFPIDLKNVNSDLLWYNTAGSGLGFFGGGGRGGRRRQEQKETKVAHNKGTISIFVVPWS